MAARAQSQFGAAAQRQNNTTIAATPPAQGKLHFKDSSDLALCHTAQVDILPEMVRIDKIGASWQSSCRLPLSWGRPYAN
jgi:hypothetical protein